MAWNLNSAALTSEAKAYLSVLGSCGDEHKAAADVGVSDATVRAWARDSEFADHRRQAFNHFEGWSSWRQPGSIPPDQLPFAGGRLDLAYDPNRVPYVRTGQE